MTQRSCSSGSQSVLVCLCLFGQPRERKTAQRAAISSALLSFAGRDKQEDIFALIFRLLCFWNPELPQDTVSNGNLCSLNINWYIFAGSLRTSIFVILSLAGYKTNVFVWFLDDETSGFSYQQSSCLAYCWVRFRMPPLKSFVSKGSIWWDSGR